MCWTTSKHFIMAYQSSLYLVSPDVFNFTSELDDMMNGNEVRSDRQTIGLSTQTESGCKGIMNQFSLS
jgi:hypothetical protein